MTHPSVNNTHNRYWRVALCAFFSFISMPYANTEVPVFLLSGQSNMAGKAAVEDLSASQKEIIEHIMINVDGECDQSKKGEWLPLGPGFGGKSSQFGPELFFGKTLADSMPNTKIAFIKYAVGSTSLGTSGGFLPPSSNNGKGGEEYNNLIDHTTIAMESFHTVFDTSEYKPRWAGFIWLQGESDAKDGDLTENYETNLENLISDIRSVAGAGDLPVIIPMITTASRWKEADKIRAAEAAIREKLENVDTVETDGFHLPDDMHYDAEGMITIGYVSAIRWLGMDYMNKGDVLVIRSRPVPLIHILPLHESTWPAKRFDVSGRLLKVRRNATEPKAVSIYYLRK